MSDPLYRVRNPACQHDWTSYDIMTCDACKAYTAEQEQLRAQKEEKHDAD